MNNHIYSIPDSNELRSETVMAEKSEPSVEYKFVNKVAELVCEVMDISWNDRRIVTSLLVNGLKDSIDARLRQGQAGLLQQYLAHELETISKQVKRSLLIPEEIKVNHEHATHAMFGDIIEYIQKNYVRKDDINSDGTFETIIEKRKELMNDGPFSEDSSRNDMGSGNANNVISN